MGSIIVNIEIHSVLLFGAETPYCLKSLANKTDSFIHFTQTGRQTDGLSTFEFLNLEVRFSSFPLKTQSNFLRDLLQENVDVTAPVEQEQFFFCYRTLPLLPPLYCHFTFIPRRAVRFYYDSVLLCSFQSNDLSSALHYCILIGRTQGTKKGLPVFT